MCTIWSRSDHRRRRVYRRKDTHTHTQTDRQKHTHSRIYRYNVMSKQTRSIIYIRVRLNNIISTISFTKKWKPVEFYDNAFPVDESIPKIVQPEIVSRQKNPCVIFKLCRALYFSILIYSTSFDERTHVGLCVFVDPHTDCRLCMPIVRAFIYSCVSCTSRSTVRPNNECHNYVNV